MTDNWHLEQKVNELIEQVNSLTKVVSALIFEIDRAGKIAGVQKQIDIIGVKLLFVGVEINKLDYSPQPSHNKYRPIIVSNNEAAE